MAYLELDTTLSGELKAMQKEVSNFARKFMRPAGVELDKLADPQDVIAKGSILWDVMKASKAASSFSPSPGYP